MKKNLKLFVVGFVFMFALLVNVNAAEVDQSTFGDCISKDGNTCKLTGNIVVEEVVNIKENITIDLNGHNITVGDNLTVTGGFINVYYGATLTINDSVGTGKISGTIDNDRVYGAIQLTTKDYVDESKLAKLVVNGGTIEGYYYGIVGNGSRHNTEIIINGGTIKGISKLEADASLGIFHPQRGKLEINGGEISGGTGIEIRSGSLIVNGGKITGNGVPVKVLPNGSGSTTFGSGIAVAQHKTGLSIDVTINKGTIEGYTAIYESNPEKNLNESISKVTLSINGGTINAINNGKSVLYSEDVTGFVKGGVFNSEIDTKYLNDKYVVNLVNGQYKVTENKTLETTDKKITFESETALDNSYTLQTTVATKEAKEKAESKLNEYYKDNKDVKDTTLVTLYDIKVSDGTNIIPMENGKFTISIDIDENVKYDNYKVIYIDANGDISEVLDAKREGNKIVFETTHLSVYGVVGYNNTTNNVVNNPNTSDNLNMIIMLGGLSLLMLGMSAYKLSKNN